MEKFSQFLLTISVLLWALRTSALVKDVKNIETRLEKVEQEIVEEI